MNITTKQLQKFKDFGEEGLDIMHLDRSQRELFKIPLGGFIIDIII
tara:strand:- start:11 stop:148 length:138 start_codon:yes stop_codon:yes gene_type:complete